MKIITINDPDHDILLTPAQSVEFPLDGEIKKTLSDMHDFVKKIDEDSGVAGMAAPQMGIPFRIIYIQFKSDWSQYRKDAIGDSMPLTALINPDYEPIIEAGTSIDFEACFSVPDIAAEVSRYNKIVYRWQNENGEYQENIAEGFLARLIQHETDHTKGILHTSRIVDGGKVISIDELMALRRKMREQDIT